MKNHGLAPAATTAWPVAQDMSTRNPTVVQERLRRLFEAAAGDLFRLNPALRLRFVQDAESNINREAA